MAETRASRAAVRCGARSRSTAAAYSIVVIVVIIIVVVIIIAKPGAMRDAWRALLTTLPGIRDIEQVEDAPTALRAVARLRPALVVVDANLLRGETESLLRQIKALAPEARRVAMTETVMQQQALDPAAIEAVMLQGAPASEVAAMIERLLSERMDH